MPTAQTIIFVYNAKGGFFNGVSDYIHKFLSPDTYECNLCAVTYDNLGMKKLWKNYIAQLQFPTRFLHKEDFILEFPSYADTILPVIFLQDNQGLVELIASEELNTLSTQEILIQTLDLKLNHYT